MDILVLDTDSGIKEYYSSLLESEFRNVIVHFLDSATRVLDFLPSHSCDLVLADSRIPDMPIFEFIEKLSARKIPCIVVSSDASERLIVECMRAGALDFIIKKNIKLGHLPTILARSFLEADRWVKTREYIASLPVRDAYLKLNRKVRSFLGSEKMEQKRLEISRGLINVDRVFNDGETYFIVFLYFQLVFPASVQESMDERRFLAVQNQIMNRAVEVPRKYGGILWTRKENAGFFAFVGEEYLAALLAAVEMTATINIFNLTIENLPELIGLNIGLTSGQTIYREDKGQIYSEALNLSAHLAIYVEGRNCIMTTANIYEQIGPRAQKYLFKFGQFEGHTVYKFEPIA